MSATNPYVRRPAQSRGPDGLADVLERVLDKGLVVAGDIQVNLLNIELLTIKVRLLVASADTAQQMGIDWWKHDPFLTGQDRELAQENAVLRERVDQLETAVGGKLAPGEPSPGDLVGEGATEVSATRGQPVPTGALIPGSGGAGGGDDEGDDEGSRADEGTDGGAESDDDMRTVEVDEVVLEHTGGHAAFRVTPVPLDRDADEEADDDDGDDEDDAGDAGPPDREELRAMTKAELQDHLRERELPVSGNKDELVDRLHDGWVEGGGSE